MYPAERKVHHVYAFNHDTSPRKVLNELEKKVEEAEAPFKATDRGRASYGTINKLRSCGSAVVLGNN